MIMMESNLSPLSTQKLSQLLSLTKHILHTQISALFHLVFHQNHIFQGVGLIIVTTFLNNNPENYLNNFQSNIPQRLEFSREQILI